MLEYEYTLPEAYQVAHIFGFADITLGSKHRYVDYEGGTHGVIRLDFGGREDGNAKGSFRTYAATAGGSPEWLATSNMDTKISAFSNRGWYIWEFSRDSKAAFFDSMEPLQVSQGQVWVPAPLKAEGADYSINLDVVKPIAASVANTLPLHGLVGGQNNC